MISPPQSATDDFQNDGSKSDAAARAAEEFGSWPYSWFEDEAYHTRGSVKGKLVLSDGRPASKAAVFLGDNRPNKTALDMGSEYYYTGYADESGNFEFKNVRVGTYGFQAWSNGSSIRDVSTSLLKNDVTISEDATTELGTLEWTISTKKKLFQVGDFDRYSYGFQYGGATPQHALVAKCPANLIYTAGCSKTSEWCFGQGYKGNWTIRFRVKDDPPIAGVKNATLIVSLAGYSSGASDTVWTNDQVVGNLTSGAPGLASDPSLYRSATAAGEWRYFEFGFDASILKKGWNAVRFEQTRNTTWHGFLWDSIILEW